MIPVPSQALPGSCHEAAGLHGRQAEEWALRDS